MGVDKLTPTYISLYLIRKLYVHEETLTICRNSIFTPHENKGHSNHHRYAPIIPTCIYSRLLLAIEGVLVTSTSIFLYNCSRLSNPHLAMRGTK